MALPAGHRDARGLASGDRNIVLKLAVQIDIRQSFQRKPLHMPKTWLYLSTYWSLYVEGHPAF